MEKKLKTFRMKISVISFISLFFISCNHIYEGDQIESIHLRSSKSQKFRIETTYGTYYTNDSTFKVGDKVKLVRQ